MSANGAERTFTGIGKPHIYSESACASFCLPLIRQKQCQARNKKDERKSQPNLWRAVWLAGRIASQLTLFVDSDVFLFVSRSRCKQTTRLKKAFGAGAMSMRLRGHGSQRRLVSGTIEIRDEFGATRFSEKEDGGGVYVQKTPSPPARGDKQFSIWLLSN